MSIWDSIADALGGIKDAIQSFPEIMKDPNAVSIGHVKVPKVSFTNTLSKGVVIKVGRTMYDHYGVYISDSCVVHYHDAKRGLPGGKNRIEKTTLKEFMEGATELKVVTFPTSIHAPRKHETYQVPSFMPQPWRRPVVSPNADLYMNFSAEEVAKRALGEVGKGGYHLLFKNCEHFAVWCATGVSESVQVQRIIDILKAGGGVYR